MSMLGAMGGGVQTVVGTAVAYLDLDTSKFESKMSTAMSQIATIGDSSIGLGDTLQNVGSGLQTMGSQMTRTFTLPIVGAMTVATKKTMDFDEAMSQVQALAQSGMKDTTKEMEMLREKALELGGSTKFTSKEVADAFGYMALAGWDTEQMISGISGVLDLAASSGMDLASASDLVTDYLSAFGKEAAYSTKMADMLSYAQANTNTTTQMLGDAFGNSAALMNTAGQSMETTISLLGMLANEGLKGSEAGTALSATMRDIYQNMYKVEDASMAAGLAADGFTSVTGDMNDVLGKQVIEIGDVLVPVSDLNGNFRDMIDIVADVEKATKGLATAEKTSALQTTFTSRSIKGMSILLEEGANKTREFRSELLKSDGTAAETAETMLDNLAGSITYLTSALDNFLIKVGDRLAPYIRQFADWLTELTSKISAMSDEEFDNMVKWGLWIAAVGPVLSIVGKLSSALGGIINLFQVLSGAKGIGGIVSSLGKLKGILSLTTIMQFIGKLAGIGSIIAGIIEFVKNFIDMWTNGVTPVKTAISALSGALVGIGLVLAGIAGWPAIIIGALVGLAAAIIAWCHEHWDEIKAFWKDKWEKVKAWGKKRKEDIVNFFKKIGEKIKTAWNDFWKAFGEGAKKFFKGFVDKIKESFNGINIIKIIKEKVIDPIKKALSDGFQASDIIEIGKAIITGLFEGIKWMLTYMNPLYWIWKFVVEPIINAFKSLLGIHSPSTVMAEIGKNIIEGLFEGIKNTWQIIIDFFNEAITAFIEWFQGLWNSLKEWWVAFWEGFHEVINGIVERFREVWQGITDWFKELWSSIIEWWNNLWNSIFEILGGLIETFKEIWNGFIEFIKNKVQEVVQNIKEKIAELWQNIKETVQKIWDFVKEAIENIWETIKTTLENIWNTVKETLENIWNTVREIISKIFEHIKEKMEEIKNFIHDKIEEIKENIKRKIEEVKEAIKQKIEELRDALVEAVNRIIEKIKELIANIKATIDEFVANIQRIIDTIKDLIHNMVEGLRSLVTKVIETIKDVVRTFIEGCVQLWEKLKENVMKVFSEVTDFFKKRWEDIKKEFEEIIEKFKDIGANIVEKIFEGIKKAWGKVEGWFSDKFGWIGGLVDKISSGINTMKDSASGLFDGGGIFGSHANGLSYVPFDGYVAELHKGERVLTKEENEAYNRGNNSGGDTFNFYNVKDDPYEYARQMKRTKKELAYT